MDTKLDLFDQTLEELFPAHRGSLFEAARYSLSGGKRLRPRLTLALLETFSQPIEKGLYPAAALEMIHTYSLIHDDLPCMDNDDERRGKPTLHKAYSESHAVLTGDFLLTFAFETLAKAPYLNPTEKIELIACLTQRSGADGMIGGQVLDLSGPIDNPEEMYLKKTGALICCALEFGGILSNADLVPLQKIGSHLGVAFQLIDDLLDKDGILKPNIAEEKALTLYEKTLEEISHLPNGAPALRKLAQEMIHRTS